MKGMQSEVFNQRLTGWSYQNETWLMYLLVLDVYERVEVLLDGCTTYTK